ncbi:MAG: thiamine pyrophosphate-dependent dehydrogenase E1 component subunit alpha [Deltaproteobacteria bacterium]|jgi:pyruvate dehydrogenase E1 component alpha subunit|nr:thiamine pyrophosphate-dependent dehydrogenase E1 component subunit alpha [Deltaproteobacteria bacterium]
MYSKELLRNMFISMTRIRYFEETIEKHFLAGEIPGFTHLYIGEEAVATGVCQNLANNDFIESTHRGHGHCIAKGAELHRMMAEIFGKVTGYCKGKGGSMHIADFSVGMLGANGVVGGGYTLATGAALAAKLTESDQVAAVFFGDGASNRGTFHEAANMAGAWKLPVIFVCENNEWASTTPTATTTAVTDIAKRAAGYAMPGVTVDGNDVFAVYDAAKKMVTDARAGKGPALLECKTYRIKGHFVGDPEKYRTKEEVQKRFAASDPLKNFETRVTNEKWMTKAELEAIRANSAKEVEEALDFAKKSASPDPSELYTDLYS